MDYPSPQQAEAILHRAEVQNPGPWIDHVKTAARAARTIAAACGLDADRAYVSGLLHDIGYYANADRSQRVCHVYAGYALMMEKGYPAVAQICLSHSFPLQDINEYHGHALTQDADERAVIEAFLSGAVYNDYDRLIQLCDGIGAAEGICLLEQRIVDGHIRHGAGSLNPLTTAKWKAYLDIKRYFDQRCGGNVYGLFRGEVEERVFGV